MFLRTVKAAGGEGVQHEYVRLVESYRDNGRNKQRVVVPARTVYVDSRPPVPRWRERVMPKAGRARRAKCETGQRGDSVLEMTTEV